MSDTSTRFGGSPVPSETLVQADQQTILGDGSHEHPLRAASDLAGVDVEDDGAPIVGNPHRTLNFEGAGVAVADAGGGVASITIAGGVVVEDDGTPIAGGPHQTIDFTGAGVTATDAGGGVAQVAIPGGGGTVLGVLTWGLGLLTTIPAFVQGGVTNNDPSTTNDFGIPMPFPGHLHNLFARHNASGGSGPVATYTIFVNGAPQSLAVSVPTGVTGQASDTTHSVSFLVGDVISLGVTSTSIGPNLFDAAIAVQISP